MPQPNYLHSHSGLERLLRFPKGIVLIDERYYSRFEDIADVIKIEPFRHGGMVYYKVSTLYFVKKGGVFKNFSE